MICEVNSNFNKQEVQLQNEIILDHCDQFDLKPCCISRDKQGHILIFCKKINVENNIRYLYCFMLGKNLSTNKILPYQVGKCMYKYNKQSDTQKDKQSQPLYFLDIGSFAVHKAFNNLGIGNVMLQAIENIAAANNINTIELNAVKCYAPLYGKNESDIKSYFDKNFYFYFSNGYVEDLSTERAVERYSMIRPLKKTKVQKILIENGYTGPLKRVDKNAYLFSIRREHSYVIDNYKDYTYYSIFPENSNSFISEFFSPLSITSDKESTQFLYKTLKTHELHPAILYPIMHISKPFIVHNKNVIYSKYCSNDKFKDFVEKTFEDNLLDSAKSFNFDDYRSQLSPPNNQEYEPEI